MVSSLSWRVQIYTRQVPECSLLITVKNDEQTFLAGASARFFRHAGTFNLVNAGARAHGKVTAQDAGCTQRMCRQNASERKARRPGGDGARKGPKNISTIKRVPTRKQVRAAGPTAL
jgi:hypothetical protein